MEAVVDTTVPKVRMRRHHVAGGVIALAIVVGIAAWLTPWQVAEEETASIEKMALPLPDKPSIAVLPFTNMSDDPQQEYFVDGSVAKGDTPSYSSRWDESD